MIESEAGLKPHKILMTFKLNYNFQSLQQQRLMRRSVARVGEGPNDTLTMTPMMMTMAMMMMMTRTLAHR